MFTNSSSTYEELGHDRDLLIVASGPSHPWLQNHTKRLPFAYTGSGLIPRRPWSPGVLLNYLTGAAAFAQLSRAYRFTENVLPVLGIAGMGSPWTSGRSTIILLATENSQIPALVDAMGYAEASLAGGDLLLAGATRRGAFVLGPRTHPESCHCGERGAGFWRLTGSCSSRCLFYQVCFWYDCQHGHSNCWRRNGCNCRGKSNHDCR